jgi:phage shock protein A
VAAERRLGRELESNRAQAEYWKARAREALGRGREDLARRALLRKREHDDLAAGLEAQHAEAVRTGTGVRTALRALEARLAEARRRQRALVARHRAARVRVEVHQAVGVGGFDAAHAKFERLADRLVEFEDEVAAQAELHQALDGLEAEFADLEREQAVAAELEALKRENTGRGP